MLTCRKKVIFFFLKKKNAPPNTRVAPPLLEEHQPHVVHLSIRVVGNLATYLHKQIKASSILCQLPYLLNCFRLISTSFYRSLRNAMASAAPTHVLLVSFPGQGHINPLLRLGKRLAAKGMFVTFSTTESMGKDMRKANSIISDQATPVGEGFIGFEFFQDGLEEDDTRRKSLEVYLRQLELAGKNALHRIIKKHADKDHPISCIINNAFIPWVCDVATDLGIPNAVLWVQSCGSFSAYYHYHHNLVPFPSESEPKINVQLPCMPLLKYDEVPDFLHPSSPYQFLGKIILGQFKNLSKSFCILMDTFLELEPETIGYMSKLCMIKPVGPLFINPKASNTRIRGDVLKADDCMEWLSSKPPASVVYIAFGSIAYIVQEQVDELAYGLLNSGISFLWVT